MKKKGRKGKRKTCFVPQRLGRSMPVTQGQIADKAPRHLKFQKFSYTQTYERLVKGTWSKYLSNVSHVTNGQDEMKLFYSISTTPGTLQMIQQGC